MPFIIVHKHYYPYDNKDLKRLSRQIKRLTTQNLKIMATLDEVVAKVAELQETVDTEQAQIAEAIATLQATVEELQAIIDAGLTPEALDGVIASLDSVIADLKATIPDDEPAPAPED